MCLGLDEANHLWRDDSYTVFFMFLCTAYFLRHNLKPRQELKKYLLTEMSKSLFWVRVTSAHYVVNRRGFFTLIKKLDSASSER